MEILNWLVKYSDLFLSVISLVISIYALIESHKAAKLQQKINEMEYKLKQYEVEKMKKEQEKAKESSVEARVVSMGNNKYKMKVWNSGNTTVKNVSAAFKDANGLIIMNKDIQPFEILEPGKNYELNVILYAGASHKYTIVTSWKDKEGNTQKKEQMGSV